MCRPHFLMSMSNAPVAGSKKENPNIQCVRWLMPSETGEVMSECRRIRVRDSSGNGFVCFGISILRTIVSDLSRLPNGWLNSLLSCEREDTKLVPPSFKHETLSFKPRIKAWNFFTKIHSFCVCVLKRRIAFEQEVQFTIFELISLIIDCLSLSLNVFLGSWLKRMNWCRTDSKLTLQKKILLEQIENFKFCLLSKDHRQ